MGKIKNEKIINLEEEGGADDGVKINEAKPSILEFTKRDLPTEQEVERFDEYIEEEAREDEIEDSLNEIYQDDKGKAVDVKKLDIKKRRGFFFWFFTLLFTAAILGGAGYGAYTYYLQGGSDVTAVELSLDGPAEVTAGQEFYYTVTFKNTTAIALNNARFSVNYPDNFVFLDAQPFADSETSIWNFPSIPAGRTSTIKIKGKIIGPVNQTGIILATLTYTPANFSSEFKKEQSLTTAVNDIGLDIDYDYISSVLIGADDQITVKYKAHTGNRIDNFRVTVEPQENIEFIKSDNADNTGQNQNIEEVRPGVWQVNGATTTEQEIPIRFKVNSKVSDTQDIKIDYEQDDGSGTFHKFKEDTITLEVMKSDLNLTMIINGAKEDQGVNFGDTLNYSIVYSNKGETDMKDVVIMAVLESDFLDWTTLNNPSQGKEKGNTITWTKAEVPGLEALKPGEEGTIDFSIKVAELGAIQSGKEYQVKSYAQYTIGNADEVSGNDDNKSNTILNKINSNLVLDEQLRYFSEDNIAVGSGPLPPKVGETTSFKVYWKLENSLHDLTDARVAVTLPDYVSWDDKSLSSVGTVVYDPDTNRVIWQIGRLPDTVTNASAEFSVKITPAEADRNKIMVITPGSTVTATDSETKTELTKTTGAKTTRLEDDNIANSDGIVR